MVSITTQESVIHFNETTYVKLDEHIKQARYSSIFILVDENTKIHCLPYFMSQLAFAETVHVLSISPGEAHKNFESYINVLEQLSDHVADRKSLLINLGGGVVTDLGGFVASTFKRGIDFINVPTSLLAMVDASIGGKTGIDLGALKNQIGTISLPQMVLVDVHFLKTLPKAHFNSGLAEMLKHGLIKNETYWTNMKAYVNGEANNLNALIYESIAIKQEIVANDPTEKGLRKTLNFGHTLGHAIESYFLEQSNLETLLHGEAIAIGMVLECFISYETLGFPQDKLDEIKAVMLHLYGKVDIQSSHIEAIIDLMIYDKKNTYGNINFVLLQNIGQPQLDSQVDNAIIKKAFSYYLN